MASPPNPFSPFQACLSGRKSANSACTCPLSHRECYQLGQKLSFSASAQKNESGVRERKTEKSQKARGKYFKCQCKRGVEEADKKLGISGRENSLRKVAQKTFFRAKKGKFKVIMDNLGSRLFLPRVTRPFFKAPLLRSVFFLPGDHAFSLFWTEIGWKNARFLWKRKESSAEWKKILFSPKCLLLNLARNPLFVFASSWRKKNTVDLSISWQSYKNLFFPNTLFATLVFPKLNCHSGKKGRRRKKFATGEIGRQKLAVSQIFTLPIFLHTTCSFARNA